MPDSELTESWQSGVISLHTVVRYFVIYCDAISEAISKHLPLPGKIKKKKKKEHSLKIDGVCLRINTASQTIILRHSVNISLYPCVTAAGSVCYLWFWKSTFSQNRV